MRSALKSWKLWFSLLLFAGLILLIEYSYGWSSLLEAWNAISVAELAIAVLLMLTTYLLRALRFLDFFQSYCLPSHGSRAWLHMLRLTVIHNFFNTLLPIRSGEATFPLLMKKNFQVPITHSAPALVWLRLLDLYALLSLGLISQLALIHSAYWLLAIPALIAPLILLPIQNQLHSLLISRSGKATTKLAELMTALPNESMPFLRAIAWTLTNWAIKLAVFSWLLKSFLQAIATEEKVTFSIAWMGSTTGELSSVLPIHGIAGAGTYEAGITAGLLPYGIDSVAALAAAVNLHLFVLGSMLLLTALITVLTSKIRLAS
ncbi:MAG: lysylphosphatidylglycerol synthase domain-containing protein [Oceanobacter sp.]